MGDLYNSPCISCCKTENLFSIFDAHSCEGIGEIDAAVDILYQCFDIQLQSNCTFDSICSSCMLKLRDAYIFKLEVLKNIQDFPANLHLDLQYLDDDVINENNIDYNTPENKKEPNKNFTQENAEQLINLTTGITETVIRHTDTQTNKENPLTGILKKINKLDRSNNKEDAKTKVACDKKKKVKCVTFLEPEVSSVKEIPIDSDEVDNNIVIRLNEQPILNTDFNIIIDPRDDLNRNNENNNKQIPNQGSLTCKICKQSFDTVQSLSKHDVDAHAVKLKCEQCDKEFSNKTAKTKHMVTHLEGPFPCKYCDQVFEKSNSRNAHVWRTHKTDTPYVCQECGDRFKTLHKRLKHMAETHGRTDPQFPCPDCDKKFFYASSRSEHVRLTHKHDRRYKCTECPMKFPKRRSLLNHMATIHDIGEKRFECHVCPKKFFRSTTLKYHLKIHERAANLPFKCTQCDNNFAYKELLKCHMKRHEMTAILNASTSEEDIFVSPVEDIIVADEKIINDSYDNVYLEFQEEYE